MHDKERIAHQLGGDNIGALIVRYSIPAILSMAAMSLYNIISSMFIGHGIGPLALSAMGVVLPLMNLMFAFSLLIGIGGASYASIYIGAGKMDTAFAVLGNVCLLNVIVSVFVAGGMLLFLDPLLIFFGASQSTLPYAADFMKVFLLSAPFTFTLFNLNHIIRATGYPTKAMGMILFSVVVNAFLTPLFIFSFQWGMTGAALGYAVSQASAMIFVLLHFTSSDRLLYFKKGIFRLQRAIVRDIFSIGLAPCMVNLFASLVVLFINDALWRFESDAGIGAFGIINRILMLFAMVSIGLSQGMQPIIGFNYGSGQWERCKRTLYYGIAAATAITTAGFVLSQFFSYEVTALFTDDPTLIALSEEGLRLSTIVFPVIGAQIIIQQFFQSIGRSQISIFLSTTRQLLLLLPFLIFLPRLYQAKGVWLSITLSDGSSFLLTVLILIVFMRRAKKNIKGPAMRNSANM